MEHYGDRQDATTRDGDRPSPAAAVRALLLVEITDFAGLRRAIGVAPSDAVMLAAAGRIAVMLPDAGVRTIGRDTIEVGLDIDLQAALGDIVSCVDRSFDRAFAIDGCTHHLHVRVGSAIGEKGGDEVALVEAAEAALARARTGDAHDVAVAVSAAPFSDAAIGQQLRCAVEHDDLFLQYQPKLHLRRQEITSVEALIRWHHPERGLVLPNDFIPAAERSGAIRAVTLWTLRRVIADQRIMRARGHDLPIFVNIAGVLLSDATFVDAAIALLCDSGVSIGFEITETSVIRDPTAAITHLQRLADIGVAITIDDYGAGLSSLAYLKQLPARELKIDKLFVTQLSSSHRDPLIVRSTIDLAHALEMEVVAEGVETPTSLALLSVMGCDMVQGFLISRPLVLEALLAFLRDETHREVLDRSRSPLQRLAAVRLRA